AVRIGGAARHHLVLEVDRIDLHAAEGPGGVQRRRHGEQLALLTALGDQADVRRQQVALCANSGRVAVVSRLAGIVAILPAHLAGFLVVLAVVFVTVPVGCLVIAAVFLVGDLGVRVFDRRGLFRLFILVRAGEE